MDHEGLDGWSVGLAEFKHRHIHATTSQIFVMFWYSESSLSCISFRSNIQFKQSDYV
jgi:hypothetical protein